MQTVIFFLIGTLLIVLQTSLLHFLPEWMGKPDLIFILIILLATSMETYRGAALVLLFGLFMDIFSGIFLGVYPLLYLLLYFAIKAGSKHIMMEEATHLAPLIMISYLLFSIGMYLFCFFLSPENQITWSWFEIMLELLILAIISIPVGHLYDRLFPLFEKNQTPLLFLKPKRRNRYRI